MQHGWEGDAVEPGLVDRLGQILRALPPPAPAAAAGPSVQRGALPQVVKESQQGHGAPVRSARLRAGKDLNRSASGCVEAQRQRDGQVDPDAVGVLLSIAASLYRERPDRCGVVWKWQPAACWPRWPGQQARWYRVSPAGFLTSDNLPIRPPLGVRLGGMRTTGSCRWGSGGCWSGPSCGRRSSSSVLKRRRAACWTYVHAARTRTIRPGAGSGTRSVERWKDCPCSCRESHRPRGGTRCRSRSHVGQGTTRDMAQRCDAPGRVPDGRDRTGRVTGRRDGARVQGRGRPAGCGWRGARPSCASADKAHDGLRGWRARQRPGRRVRRATRRNSRPYGGCL